MTETTVVNLYSTLLIYPVQLAFPHLSSYQQSSLKNVPQIQTENIEGAQDITLTLFSCPINSHPSLNRAPHSPQGFSTQMPWTRGESHHRKV